MNPETLWLEFSTLPPKAQDAVLEFIIFMQNSYQVAQKNDNTDNEKLDLLNDPFFGMWQDREDMQDSTAWVRETRQEQWSRNR